MSAVEAYVSLGSNLGDRAAHLASAIESLAALPQTRVLAVSPVYETDPIGPPPQGPYLNAAVQLQTGLAARRLLDHLLAIEARAGRRRGSERWTARTLDLDLLLHGAAQLAEPGLALPHPRLAERPFVLEPLSRIAPRLVHPALGVSIEELARGVRDPRAVRRWGGELGSRWFG